METACCIRDAERLANICDKSERRTAMTKTFVKILGGCVLAAMLASPAFAWWGDDDWDHWGGGPYWGGGPHWGGGPYWGGGPRWGGGPGFGFAPSWGGGPWGGGPGGFGFAPSWGNNFGPGYGYRGGYGPQPYPGRPYNPYLQGNRSAYGYPYKKVPGMSQGHTTQSRKPAAGAAQKGSAAK